MSTEHKREESIEAFRVLLMLGICLLHVCGAPCGHQTQWLANLLYWCVPGFVFISGWFGMRFSFKKIVRLYGLALYAVLIAYVVKRLMGEAFDLVAAVRLFRDYWFLNSYVVLMMMAPGLNKLISSSNEYAWTVPLLTIPFVWGFLSVIPIVGSVVPRLAAISPYGPFMMIGVYVVARVLRGRDVEQFLYLHHKAWVALVFVSAILCMLGLCEFNSPFSLVLAVAAFFLAKRSTFMNCMGRYIAWITPSLFSIYLLHSRQALGFEIINKCESCLLANGVPLFAVYLIMTFAVFFVCVMVDMPRRFAVHVFCRVLQRHGRDRVGNV